MKLSSSTTAKWIATGFGLGLLKPAPGTWGSLGGLLAGAALLYTGGYFLLFMAIAVANALGLWAVKKYETAENTHDDKKIVIDEVVGQWIALIPAGLNLPMMVLSFLLFRFFDITKLWPAAWIDRNVKGAAGVMGDDVVAGIYAALFLTGLKYAGFG